MINQEGGPISKLKTEFVRKYDGNGHIREAIPNESSKLIPIDESILREMHEFAKKNPIYYNSYTMEILEIPCTVYEGDINEYWISSIKHDLSNQPFYPTWILSAYNVASESKRLGMEQLVDIGSGDGRIAYCGELVGLDAYGIEIDEGLSKLQKQIVQDTGVRFGVNHADANEFDYTSLELTRPAFFIGGLPEMGEMMAKNVIGKILSYETLRYESAFVFMGSFETRMFSKSREKGGWGFVIDQMGLDVKSSLVLPTCWTMDQQRDTPYIFTKKKMSELLYSNRAGHP